MTAERGARLLLLGRDFDDPDDVQLHPRGAFQRENFAVAVAAAEAFRRRPRRGARPRGRGVRCARRAGWRWWPTGRSRSSTVRTTRPGSPRLLAALGALVGERPLVGVMSVLDDKDAAGMLAALLPLFDAGVFTRSSHRGALPPATLESLWRQLGGPDGEIVADAGRGARRVHASLRAGTARWS